MIKSLYPIFQHWSKTGSVYIISDTHFDDEDRKFMGYNISEQEQINKIKQYCHKNDTLIHLGDVGNPEYLNQLECYKVLIMGNHDQSVKKFKPFFNEIYSGPLMISQKIILSHEPLKIYTALPDIPIAFNIHGHDHSGKECNDSYHLNCASNVSFFELTSLSAIIEWGLTSDKHIKSIHRQTIDIAIERNELDDLFNE